MSDFIIENRILVRYTGKSKEVVVPKGITIIGNKAFAGQDITKVIDADIFVIDFPLLDTRVEGKNLVGKFISDIVLQVLSFVAQNERENIRKRQAEGIKIAKANGVHMGRPKYKLPDNFEEVVRMFHNKEITNIDAAKLLNMTRGTFLKYSKLYK